MLQQDMATAEVRSVHISKMDKRSSSERDVPLVSVNNDADVLCGRGGLTNHHPGNRLFRRVVNENKEVYQNSQNSSEKYALMLSIVMAMERREGRFLKHDEKRNRWVEVSRKEATSKTAQALREQEGEKSQKRSEAAERVMERKRILKKERQQQEGLQEQQHVSDAAPEHNHSGVQPSRGGSELQRTSTALFHKGVQPYNASFQESHAVEGYSNTPPTTLADVPCEDKLTENLAPIPLAQHDYPLPAQQDKRVVPQELKTFLWDKNALLAFADL